jgi:glucose-6-phosphate isomerase
MKTTAAEKKQLLEKLEKEKDFDQWAVDFGRKIKKEAYQKIEKKQ